MKDQDMEKRLERYTSKRNVVFKKDNWVYKCHKSVSAAKAEAQFLRQLAQRNVRVPQLRHCVGRVLVLQPVHGLPLPQLLCRSGASFDVDTVAQGLVNWFEAFYAAVNHSVTEENRGDVNGRNFLIDGSVVWGLDFEERSHGPREEDFGRLAAFLECYDGCDEGVAQRLSAAVTHQGILQLGLNAGLVESEKQKEFVAMEQRRRRKRADRQEKDEPKHL